MLGDKGYVNGHLQQVLAARNDLALLTPRRKNQKAQLPEALTPAINEARQIIETVNSQLVGQCNLQRNRAKPLYGWPPASPPSSPHTPSACTRTFSLGDPCSPSWTPPSSSTMG